MKYLITLIIAFCLAYNLVYGATDEEIAQAIYMAEGAELASKPYGILSVPCDSKESCKVICLNTIRNNRKRYADYGYKDYDTYLEFLASRYAPINCSNDNGTNQFWLKNVLFYLGRSKSN